jgi:hypothetical protein
MEYYTITRLISGRLCILGAKRSTSPGEFQRFYWITLDRDSSLLGDIVLFPSENIASSTEKHLPKISRSDRDKYGPVDIRSIESVSEYMRSYSPSSDPLPLTDTTCDYDILFDRVQHAAQLLANEFFKENQSVSERPVIARKFDQDLIVYREGSLAIFPD